MKITVIGAGPGGYEAAIMAAKLGAEVTLVEKDQLGGTCLNRGCIPTKAFLACSDVFDEVERAKTFGIIVDGDIKIDYPAILARKNKVVADSVAGINYLMKTNKIRVVEGFGKLIDHNTVAVTKDDGTIENIVSDKIILATGSIPVNPGMFKYDGKKVITSDEVLELEVLPESMVIVGGGVIGCEIGQFLSRMGVTITIVEGLAQLLPNMDEDVSKQLLRQFKKEKIKVFTGVGVAEVKIDDDRVIAELTNGKAVEAETMLVCIGRRGYTDGLNAKAVGVLFDDKGRIVVNDKMETSVDGIYAIGDIIASPQLAHMASVEGITAAYNAVKDADKKVSYKAVPGCVFTDPEIASCGLSEKDCQSQGITYKTGTYDYRALGKARAMGKLTGFFKVIVDKNDVIIGGAVVGAHGADLLAELTLAVELGLTAEQVGNVIHPHPALSEGLKEALHDVHGMSINK